MSDPSERRSVTRNGFWAAALSGVTSAVGAIVALLLVLVLPVEEYGIYSYATSLAAIGMAVAQGGLASLAVRLLVDDKAGEPLILSLVLVTRATFALIGYVLIVAISLTSGEFPTFAATLIAGLALFGRSANAADFWYQAHMRNEVPATIRIAVTLISLGARLAALWLWPSVWLFLALFVAEAAVGTLAVWVRFLTDRSAPRLARPRARETVELARGSLPLTLAGLANQVNMRGDVVVLQALSGASAVGVYSVAARISELAVVLPTAFMNATLPVLVRARRKWGSSDPRYLALLQQSYDRAFWVGILVAGAVGLIGTVVIDLLLGPEYRPAVPVLWIQLATCPFVFMALVYSKWIIAEGTLWLSLVRHSIGAVINIALNLLLIPSFGLVGAAVSTLVSYVFASYLSCFLSPKSRIAAKQMSLAAIAPARWIARLLGSDRSNK